MKNRATHTLKRLPKKITEIYMITTMCHQSLFSMQQLLATYSRRPITVVYSIPTCDSVFYLAYIFAIWIWMLHYRAGVARSRTICGFWYLMHSWKLWETEQSIKREEKSPEKQGKEFWTAMSSTFFYIAETCRRSVVVLPRHTDDTMGCDSNWDSSENGIAWDRILRKVFLDIKVEKWQEP